jgi:hypothetical protein
MACEDRMIANRPWIALLTADEAHAIEAEIITTGDRLRQLLLAFADREGYRALGYPSYTAWAEAIAPRLFGVSRTRITRELTAALIERELVPMGTNSSPLPERQLRPLGVFITHPRGPGAQCRPTTIDAPAMIATWQAAHAIAADRQEPFRAEHVQEATAAYIEQNEGLMIDRPTRFTRGMRSSDSAEWYTPDQILDPVRAVFGTIDTDPCTHVDAQRNVQARRYYTKADDGLRQPWEGPSAFVNPPYGDAIKPWIPRLIDAYISGECRSVIALLPCRTDTDWFTPLFRYPICFVHGRLTFSNAPAAATFPSVVVYLGRDLPVFRRAFAEVGPILLPDTPDNLATM